MTVGLSAYNISAAELVDLAIAADELGFESLWLGEQGHDDLLLAYPTTDRAALAPLRDHEYRPILMVDCVEHLDLIGPGEPAVRVCIDVDLSFSAVPV